MRGGSSSKVWSKSHAIAKWSRTPLDQEVYLQRKAGDLAPKVYNTPYLNVVIMEKLEGVMFASLVRQQGGWRKSLSMAFKAHREIIKALRVLNDRGVMHLDVHGGNIFLYKGKVTFIDFGLASDQVDVSLQKDKFIAGMCHTYRSNGELEPKDFDVFIRYMEKEWDKYY